MPMIDARMLTPVQQRVLVDWLREEGLDPQEISGERFVVHNGRISGMRFLFDADGNPIWRGNEIVRVPFNVPQTLPLPKEL